MFSKESFGVNRTIKVGRSVRDPSILCSPFTALIPVLFILIIGLVIPPDYYYSVVDENDSLYANLSVVIFVFACILFFYLGFTLAKKVNFLQHLTVTKKFYLAPLAYLGMPIAVATFLTLVYFVGLISKVNIFLLLLSPNGGQSIKQMILSSNIAFEGANQFAAGVLWWAWSEHFRVSSKFTFRFVLFFTIAFCLLLIVQADRALMMAFLLGIFVINVKYQSIETGRSYSFLKLVKYSFYALVLTLTFIGFSYLRGNQTSSLVLINFLGYGPASFNRLASVLQGRLIFPDAGHAYYLFQIEHIPFTNGDFLKSIGYPDGLKEFYDEFEAINLAGLNAAYQWATVFGYVFASAGIFSVLYFFLYGLFTGIFYRSFCRHRPLGTIFYPLAWVSISLWFSFNTFFYWLPLFSIAYMFISLYTIFFSPVETV